MDKEKVPVSVITLVVGIAIAIVSFWYGQNNGLLPEQASEQAPLVDGFFNLMVTIATGLFFVVEGTIIFCAIAFRQRKGDDADGPPIEGNVPLEIFWTAIPTLIVLGLGVYSVQVYREMGGFEPAAAMVAHHHDGTSHGSEMAAMHSGAAIAAPLIADSEGMEPAEAKVASKQSKYGFGATPEEVGKLPDLAVEVTGIQYAWLFNYPGDIIAGELHVPVGKDVLLNLSAQDVIHSFWVPQFRLKQDAIPGKDTQLRFVATKVGEYPVYCAELCGAYHGAMRTQVIVHTEEDYESWLAENAIALQEENATQTVALNVAELSESEYLTPYAKEIGIDSQTLSQID
ncbi:MAG: cytochrome c oxidase subunit II [Cyanobacteriota bacterium]|nr:cytochrome c oxidase subunit II [Cyanobacteriota bacterium]